jgi:tetratricopeptide (TPR) repeat protein
LKNFDQAIASFDKALAINPNNTKALSEKGNALVKLKDFNEAIASFDKALAINPNSTDVLNDKERALDALSRVE